MTEITLTPTDVAKLTARAVALMTKAVVQTFVVTSQNVVLANQVVLASGSSTLVADASIDALAVLPVEWSAQVDDVIVPFLGKVYERGAAIAVAGVKDAVELVDDTDVPQLSDDATVQYLQQATNRIKHLSSELWELTRNELISGVMAGESVEDLAVRVKSVTDVAVPRANVIARTEVMAAVNGGQYEQMRQLADWGQLSVTMKWEATEDGKTRPTHTQADGQTVPLDSYFSVGSKQLRFPSDPAGGGEAINCRCTVLYDISDASVEALSAAAVVGINGQFEVFQDNLSYVKAIIAAAGKKWKSADHPRGANGRFIKKGFLADTVLDMIKESTNLNEMTEGEYKKFVDDAVNVTSEQWNALTPEQKVKLQDAANDALDMGTPGSANAVIHFEDLDNDELIEVDGQSPDVFTPPPQTLINIEKDATEETNAIVGITNTSGQYLKGLMTKDEYLAEVVKDLGKINTPESKQTMLEAIDKTVAEAEQKFGKQKIPGGWTKQSLEEMDYEEYTSLTISEQNQINDAAALLSPDLVKKFDNFDGGIPSGKDGDPGEFSDLQPPSTQLSPPKSVKITHSLIHKKHSSGTTIAVATDQDGSQLRVRWNGSEYVVEKKSAGSSMWGVLDVVKKSKLYDLLADQYTGANWKEPGKLENTAPPAVSPKMPPKKMGGKTLAEAKATYKAQSSAVGTHTNPMNLAGWKQVGSQAGSNVGGLYEAPDGTKYYVKKAKSPKHARNEILANQLYQAAGVDVPEVTHGVNAPGISGAVIVSKIVPNAKSDLNKKLGDLSYIKQVQSGFAVDTWLANWDVVGLGYDNIVTSDGKPWRIDNGGALLYRAQGAPKGIAFGDDVKELNTFIDGTNSQASQVFNGMSQDERIQSAKKLLPLTDAKIDQLVQDAGMPQSLADTLKARRKFILQQYGLDGQNVNTPAPNKPVVYTKDELQKLWLKGLITTDELHEQLDEIGESIETLNLSPPSDEDIITNWQGVANSSHLKFMNGEIVATTTNGELKLTKHVEPNGDVFFSVTGKHSGINHTGIPESQLATQMEKWYNGPTWVLEPEPIDLTKPKTQAHVAPAGNGIADGLDIDGIGITWSEVAGGVYNDGDVVAHTKDGKFRVVYAANALNNFVIQQNQGTNWAQIDVLDDSGLSFGGTSDTPDDEGQDWTEDYPGEWVTGEAPTTPSTSPTPSVSPQWTVSSTSIMDVYKTQPVGTVFAEGTSAGGSKYRIVSAIGPNGDVALYAQLQVDSDTWDTQSTELNQTILAAWLDSKSMMPESGGSGWQIPGAPTTVPTNTTLSTSTKLTADDVGFGEKHVFYDLFKKQNISLSWSPKAIYEKLLAAQQQSTGVKIKQLDVAELLKVIDFATPTVVKNKAGSSTPFSDKITAWSSTSAGMKVISANPSPGLTYIQTLNLFNKKVSTAPNSTPTPSALPKVTQAVPSSPPGVPVPIPGAQAEADQVLAGAKPPPLTIAQKANIYSFFKSQPGSYLKDDPSSIWKALDAVKKTYATSGVHLSKAQILKIVDEEGAKKFKATNNFAFESKIKQWLSTPKGMQAATHEMPFDADTVLQHNAPSAATIVPLASQPDRTKAEVLAMNSSDFKVMSTSQAKAWYDKQNITGSQKTSQKKYTGSYYGTVNNVLRLKSSPTPAVLKDIQNMQAGMRPIDQDIIVHRGTGFSQFGGAHSHEDLEKLVGKTVQDKAFMSTSVGGKAAFSGQVLMEIEVPKGTGMMYVKPFSNYASENEMLLSAGLRFRVLSVTKVGHQTVVRVRVVPPPDGSV